jgi:uncharacterized integral membrane protein
MSEDPTRATRSGAPRHGSVGPADPHADPATDPALRPVGHGYEGHGHDGYDGYGGYEGRGREGRHEGRHEGRREGRGHEGPTASVGEPPTAPVRAQRPPSPDADGPAVPRTRTGGLWTGLVLSAVVLVFLLVFILQNPAPVEIRFLVFAGQLPVGVALLLAAVAGVLLVAIPAALRILQLRRAVRR